MAETAEPAATEAPESEIEAEAEPEAASGYPPYAPFSAQSAPASVAETIIAGRDLRTQFKFLPKEPVRPPPRPAKPRGPKATDVKLTKRAFRAHARCLRRHGAVLTDRLENMAKPKRRSIIYTWRDYANVLAPETIGRIRAMLDADEPFKPEQAYEYFVNLRKSRKKKNKTNINQLKKDMMAICDDKRFLWARNATIAFARGIQQRLSKPGRYALADGMLRLSNLILRDICGYMKMKPPSRNNTNPKARFMMEMSDKIVVWIDEILTESDDRMLMMDFDEDEDIVAADAAGDAGFADDFLKMMQDKPQPPPTAKKPKFPPAYLKFTGDMLEAFKILTEGMEKKGDENLIEYGKFRQSYAEGANLLKETPTFDVLEINSGLAQNLNHALSDTVKSTTPKKLEKAMKGMVDLCSNFLAENADNNKDKGPAFKALIGALLKKPNELLFEKDTIKEKYSDAATELDQARGLESDHDDPTLSNIIEQNLTKVAADVTTPELQADMKETVPLCSKYLSQNAIDKLERGPAFDLLIKSLKYKGADSFTPQYPELAINFNAAHVLSTAPGLTSIKPNDETKPTFESCLHKVVDLRTPKQMKGDMDAVIKRCANYLSGFQRDREKALKMLLEAMKKKPTKELAKRNNYAMTYGVGAGEVEKTPALIPYLPVKDIAKDMKEKLTEDVKDTPADLQVPMKTVVRDVSDVLSQPVAMKSGAAGDKYAMDYLIAVDKSMGTKPLYEYKGYNENYIGGAESLQRNAETENMVENKDLEKDILMELQGTIPPKLTPMITEEINAPVIEASHCLASIGTKKGIALEHLVGVMKGKGEASLVNLQGYSQSYTEGADRLAHSPNLATDKEDKAAYGTVKGKLDALVKEKPPPDNAKDQMEEMVDVSSKYLSAPLDDELSKRRFLCDLMASKQSEVVAQQGVYKMTYKEAAQEIVNAPANPPKNIDEKLKSDIKVKIDKVVPQKLQIILKDTVTDAASNLADIVKGRGEIVQKIHDGMETEGSKQFLSVGQFNKTYEESAQMLENAENFSTDHFATVIGEKVTERVTAIPLEGVSPQGKEHVQDGTETVSNYIAGIATKECGLDANALAGWDFNKTAQGPPPPPPPPPIIPTVSSQAMPSRKEKETPKPVTKAMDVDMDHEQAVQILTRKLKSRGGEIFYKQPRNELTHAQASDWISEAPSEVIKPVKKSSDTGRLHKKFERKLSALVASETPSELQDTMQDVIIESSRYLSETFLSKSYKILAREAVISEMQNRCNELLVDIDDGTETFFYAAQRLKKTKSFDTDTPIEKIESYLLEKLNEMIKLSHGTLRKLGPYIKDYIQSTSKYLSQHVTKPDKDIDAYIALLTEMELAGDDPLIEGNISKTNKEAAAYLRKLTTFEDEINKPDQTLKTTIESKLKNLMANVTPAGYEKANMDNVIRQNAGLLASYIKLQQEKTEALKILIEQMDNENENVLLRHGTLRKSYHDGANLLRTKTADQLQVTNPDPVVSRKIQIKLKTLVDKSFATNKYKDLIEDVVEDVMNYLAVYFLQPEIIQVCKCMKNVFIQCELWCEETVRKMSKPCCKCSRHVSVQSLADVCPGRALQLSPSGARVCGEGVEITLTQCPSKHARFGEVSTEPCPAEKPTSGCKSDTTAAFMLYAAHGPFDNIPTKLSATGSSDQMTSEPSFHTPSFAFSYSIEKTCSGHGEMLPGPASSHSFDNKLDTTVCTSKVPSFGQTSIIMMAHDNTHPTYYSPNVENDNIRSELSRRSTTPTRNVFSSRTPIATTDQMYDWQSMIVSLSWNVQAWRVWIHDNINKILNIQENKELDETWTDFQRTTTTEILQWQQYNAFSRQLIIRIATKYKNKKIVSPTRSTVKTRVFIEAHNEMLELIETFNRWTQWLAITIKETDLLLQYRDSTSERWRILKEKVKDHITDWKNYNEDLSESWETRFKLQMSDWLPGWQQPGLVWVVSACGAVPSGAVAAGICDGEAIWVARTTHMSKTLPAALYPSKHCCILYSGGRIHHYTKYQVMCNAMVEWIACRAGNVLERAVSVGNVYVGRVRYRTSYLLGAVAPPRYRCYVVMFGRPVAFDCYELLVMQDDQT